MKRPPPGYYLGVVSLMEILAGPTTRPAVSPLLRRIRRVLGSTCRLRGVRIYRGERATQLVIPKELASWEERWQTGAAVAPVRVWVESRPTVAATPETEGTVRRASQ